MKHVFLVTAAPTPAAGQLPMAMDTSVPSARMKGLRRLLGHSTVAHYAESNAWMARKSSGAHNALAVTARNTSYFAHGRRGAFPSRTRGLVQHDV